MMARLKGRRQVEVGTSEGRRRSRERKKEIRESKVSEEGVGGKEFHERGLFLEAFLRGMEDGCRSS